MSIEYVLGNTLNQWWIKQPNNQITKPNQFNQPTNQPMNEPPNTHTHNVKWNKTESFDDVWYKVWNQQNHWQEKEWIWKIWIGKCFIFVVSHIQTQKNSCFLYCSTKKPGWPSFHCVCVCVCVFVVSMFVLGSGLG